MIDYETAVRLKSKGINQKGSEDVYIPTADDLVTEIEDEILYYRTVPIEVNGEIVNGWEVCQRTEEGVDPVITRDLELDVAAAKHIIATR